MDARFDAMAGYILDGLTKNTLSDAIVHEFTEYVCKIIQKESEIYWDGNVRKLWEYLAGGRTAWEHEEQSGNNAFRQGRLYSVLEMLKMIQEQQEADDTLEQDAREYGRNRYKVFEALKNGRSLTHRELADTSGLSESSLSQFMHSIESKKYVYFRKVGRTKYYRLSGRGQKLLACMSSKRDNGVGNVAFKDRYLDRDYSILWDGKRPDMGKTMNFHEQYVTFEDSIFKYDYKSFEKTDENEYLVCNREK